MKKAKDQVAMSNPYADSDDSDDGISTSSLQRPHSILQAYFFHDVKSYLPTKRLLYLFVYFNYTNKNKITNFGFDIRIMSVWSFAIMNSTRQLNLIQFLDKILNRCIEDDVSVACPPENASYTLDTLLINIDCDIIFHANLILQNGS